MDKIKFNKIDTNTFEIIQEIKEVHTKSGLEERLNVLLESKKNLENRAIEVDKQIADIKALLGI